MEWNRIILAVCLCMLAVFAAYENFFYQPPTATPSAAPASIGHSSGGAIAAQDRVLNRSRRAQEESVTYPFYTISPRYYYQNSPYHQSRYSYYNGFRYFYPNYDPPAYYYGSPYSVGLSLQFEGETPETITPQREQ